MAGTPITPITLFKTIRARLVADSALTTLVGTDIYMEPAPTGAAVSSSNTVRVVYRGTMDFSDAGTTPTTFTSLGVQATMQVGVQWWRQAGDDDAESAALRIMGNYDPSSQTAPTYGLHQWTSTVTGWTFQPWLVQEAFSTPISDDVIETLYTFECVGEMS
jgi:hypothetical protein